MVTGREADAGWSTPAIRARTCRKHAFDWLVAHPPAGVHATLMEGTHMARGHDGAASTEHALEERLRALIADMPQMVLVAYSAQNIDASSPSIEPRSAPPDPCHGPLRRDDRARHAYGVDPPTGLERRSHLRPTLTTHPRRALTPVRPDLGNPCAPDPPGAVCQHRRQSRHDVPRLDGQRTTHAGCLSNAALAWSMWAGYLRQPSGTRLRAWLTDQEIPVTHLHTSGHASSEDLRRLRAALGGRVGPIHTAAPERFADVFADVEPHSDGEWCSV
jgi:ribonuclease J